jgi:hypothetical protein
MSALSLAERITTSFYAWEIRGRGWWLTDYAVALEPPHRPLLLLPDATVDARPIDDGRRPTIASTLIEGVQRLFSGAAPPKTDLEEAEAFVEQEPFPAELEPAPVVFRIGVPSDWKADIEQTRQLLLALSACMQPVSVELVGRSGTVTLQIACHEADQETILAILAGHVPEISVIAGDDVLTEHWDSGRDSVVVDFALEHEFFLPIQAARSLSNDPYIPLVSALARAGADECACMQVLIERVRNPWERTIREAVTDGKGGSLLSDAPEFVPLAKEKTETPLFAVVLRLGTQADTPKRAWELARATQGFIAQFSRPESNQLAPLVNDDYPDGAHETALLSRTSYRTGMLLSTRELVGLAHLPDASVKHPALVRVELRSKEVPREATGHAFVLGMNLHRGQWNPVSISTEARLAHMHVIGASGAGKSSFLLSLIMHDIVSGEGVAVLDPHGDLVDDILARIPDNRMNDVIVFDPADEAWPVGFNILAAGSESERTLLASDLVAVFARLSTSWGDTMNTVLGQAVLAILESTSGGTLLDLRRFLIDDGFRKEYLSTISDQEVHFFWEKEYPLIGTRSIGPIVSRLDTLLRSKLLRHILGQRETKLNLADAMNGGKIFLAKLSQGLIGEENAALLGSLVVSKFHQHALARQALRKTEAPAILPVCGRMPTLCDALARRPPL